MKISHQSPWLWRPAGATVVASLSLPLFLAGCGSKSAPQPQSLPTQSTVSKPGLSGKQKLTLLAGAAAMYYLYRKYQRDNAAALSKAEASGGKIQYYRSEKGGYIYFRDPTTHKAIKVTPPIDAVGTQKVPDDELHDYDYQKFQGYNNAPTGETLDKYFPVQ